MTGKANTPNTAFATHGKDDKDSFCKNVIACCPTGGKVSFHNPPTGKHRRLLTLSSHSVRPLATKRRNIFEAWTCQLIGISDAEE